MYTSTCALFLPILFDCLVVWLLGAHSESSSSAIAEWGRLLVFAVCRLATSPVIRPILTMLYDQDTSLSRDTQSTCEAEAILAREAANLNRARPQEKVPQKQRMLHFLTDKVHTQHTHTSHA